MQRGGAIFGFQNPVALLVQILMRKAAEIGLVFDKQDRLLSAIGAGKAEGFLHGGRFFTAVGAREIGAEGGAALRLAVDKNKGAALFDDAVNGGRPRPVPLAPLVVKKGSKMWDWVSLSMPTPVSLMASMM